MKTVRYKFGVSYGTCGCTVALGFFDGIHKGHRQLILSAVADAKKGGVPSAVFTFAHGEIKADSPRIYSEEQRAELLTELGVDVCFVAEFSELCTLSPSDFVSKTIIRDIGAEVAVSGYNYRFGHRGAADAKRLCELMEQNSASALIFDELSFEGEPISSTRVRSCLEEGRIEDANAMLGAPYFVSGVVEHGRGDGKGFGFPTVNISALENGVRLRYGVYLTAVKIGEKLYTGLTNVGECPSFGKREYHTETYITNYSADVYGMEIKVYFLAFLREERVFATAEALGEQIKNDLKTAQKKERDIKWQELGLALR